MPQPVSQVTILDSNFTSNRIIVRSTTELAAYGGALWIDLETSTTITVVIAGTTFRDNSIFLAGGTTGAVTAQGGALWVTAPTTVISNCTLVNNVARVVANSLSVRERAMGGAMDITGALIMNNTAVRGNAYAAQTGPLGNADPISDGFGGGVHLNGTLRAWRVRISFSTRPGVG
jgi:hypothetical protein